MNRTGQTFLTATTRLRCTGLILALSFLPASGQSTHPKASVYDEPYRPQVHFSPERHWTNDPNGLVYFKGEYHLFYQYNPFGDTWGHMSWGHAVSPDLLHWKELPVAIPETDAEMIFTGSVVVDERNTSGLCRNGSACLVAIYTGHRGHGETQREVQNIAASQDMGRTWQAFSGNPVIDLKMSNFRDPSVSWSDDDHAWLMVVSLPNEHEVAFYTSPDLKHWTRRSTFGPAGATGGQWECPDLLRVPERNGKDVWALKVGLNPGSLQGGSGEQFFIGSFDGTKFTQSTEPGSHGWTDYGKDSYCAISYNHLPAGEKPTLIGWMNNWQYADKLPTAPWRGQMTLARRLTAVHDQAGVTLAEEPVIEPLRKQPAKPLSKTLLASATEARLINSESPAELQLSFQPGDSQSIGLRVYSDDQHWTEVGFDNVHERLYVDRTHSGFTVAGSFPARTEAPLVTSRPWNLHLVLDRSSVAVFAQDGTLTMTNLIFPFETRCRVMFFRQGGTQAASVTGNFWKLRSIWQRAATASTTLQEGR